MDPHKETKIIVANKHMLHDNDVEYMNFLAKSTEHYPTAVSFLISWTDGYVTPEEECDPMDPKAVY